MKTRKEQLQNRVEVSQRQLLKSSATFATQRLEELWHDKGALAFHDEDGNKSVKDQITDIILVFSKWSRAQDAIEWSYYQGWLREAQWSTKDEVNKDDRVSLAFSLI